MPKQGSSKIEIMVTDTNGRNLKVDRKHLKLTSYHGHDPLTKRPAHSIQTFDMDGQVGIGTKNSIGSGVAIAATTSEIRAVACSAKTTRICPAPDPSCLQGLMFSFSTPRGSLNEQSALFLFVIIDKIYKQ